MNSQMTIVILILGGALSLWGLKLKKTNKALGSSIAVLFSLLTLGVAGQRLWQELNRDALFAAKTMRATEARGEVLGAHIASTYPDARVLILRSPTFPGVEDYNASEDMILAGLLKGLPTKQVAGEMSIPIPEKILESLNKESSGEMDEMLMYEIYEFENWFSAEVFDQLVTERRADFDILLTLASLPADLEASKVLATNGAPKIVCGGYSNLDIDPYIRKGIVVASISHKRGEKGPSMSEAKLPESSLDIFNLWYEIITPKNVDPAPAAAAPSA